MKELSIEEKAKAYDEALSVAQETYTTQPMYREWLAKMFPELKESEGEKTKKEILDYIIKGSESYYDVQQYGKEKFKKWIAWLEKQGENTYNKELSELLHKVICRFINDPDIPYSDREKVSMKVLPYVERLEKQGEQMPVDKVDSNLLTVERAKKMSPFMKTGFKNEPAKWSEEDENIRQWIISDIDKLLALKKKSYIIADKEINWLKSLRPQINITDEELAQAKKDAYNDALDKIEFHSGKSTFDDGWSAAIWYLKKRNAQPQNRWKESLATADLENSLCDMQDGFSDTSYEYRILGEAIEFIRCTESKPQWKPNDEQMQFLLKYAEQNNYDGSILISLYKDLKKLRGE